MSKDFMERRRYVRIPMVSVIHVRQGISGEFLHGLLVDLSCGGARIMSQFMITVGDELFLRIPLAEDYAVDVVGDVVWTKEMELMKEYNFGIEYMAGVQFREVNQEIRTFISQHTGKS